jgi:hypothetical protein
MFLRRYLCLLPVSNNPQSILRSHVYVYAVLITANNNHAKKNPFVTPNVAAERKEEEEEEEEEEEQIGRNEIGCDREKGKEYMWMSL